MSISLAGFPATQYIGSPYMQPMQIAGKAGKCVPLTFNWLAYGVGNALPALVVNINLQTNPQSPAPFLDQIRSLYIDNSGNPYTLIVQFPDTGFIVQAQPYATGWYPVFTNKFVLNVAVLGFNNNNNNTQVDIFVTNVFAPPYTDAGLQSVLGLKLASPSIGAGGASLTSVFAIMQGSSYTNGGLQIIGGGGINATVNTIIDAFGRFSNPIVITNGGEGFTGQPIITPTAAQNPPPNFSLINYAQNQQTVFNSTIWFWNGSTTIQTNAAAWNVNNGYAGGVQVSFQNFIYQSTQPNGGKQPNTNPQFWTLIGSQQPNTSFGWVNTGILPSQTATFSSIIGTPQNPIVSSGFALPALGDQVQTVSQLITAIGVLESNLFGSPYGSGFIYLTCVDIQFGAGSTAIADEINLQDTDGTIIIGPIIGSTDANGRGAGGLHLDNCNIKIDATKTYELKCVSAPGNIYLDSGFTYTWAQQ